LRGYGYSGNRERGIGQEGRVGTRAERRGGFLRPLPSPNQAAAIATSEYGLRRHRDDSTVRNGDKEGRRVGTQAGTFVVGEKNADQGVVDTGDEAKHAVTQASCLSAVHPS